ncbi:MAG: pseudouridine synthase, partial [Planctomycetota bacterium]
MPRRPGSREIGPSPRARRRSCAAEDPSSWLHPSAREVYRDEHLWALEKPPGILSHPNPPARRAENGILRVPYDQEEEAYRARPESPGGPAVHLIHRLDQETSGLILCAFDPETAARLKEALYRREVLKEYRALVLGVPRPARGRWSDRLEKVSRSGKLVVRARPGPPNAVTEYAVIRAFPRAGLSLLS